MTREFVAGARPEEDLDLLLVNTPLRDYQERPRTNNYTLPVLGMGYIATLAAVEGFNVGVLDAESEGLAYEQTKEIINRLKPRWAGFGLLAPTYEASANICNSLNSDINILLGGHQAKAVAREILIDPRMRNCKALVIGEGETRTVELLRNIDNRTRLPGVMWLADNRNIMMGEAKGDSEYYTAPDIDKLPLLDRKFLPQDPYTDESGVVHANIVSARGCPYNCSFCGGAASVNPDIKIRSRSPESVVYEMNMLNKKYGVTSFRFVDDLFLGNRRMIADMTSAFAAANIGEWAQWSGTGRINVFDQLSNNQINLMHESGLKEIAFGIESGNEHVLKRIDKRIDTEMTRRVVSKLLERGIDVKGYFILGHVDETEDEIRDTLSLIHELWSFADSLKGNFRASTFEFRPYPGTIDWKRLLCKGFTPEELSNYTAIDLTDRGTRSSMLDRDEFNFSTNLQIASAPIEFIRESLISITDMQHKRNLSQENNTSEAT